MNVIFVDRDGTIIVEPPDEQVDSLEKLEFLPGAISGLRTLTERGYALVMVTNQDDLGTDRYPKASYDAVQGKLLRILESEGVRFEEVFVCPHGPNDGCACRKPRTGLLTAFLSTNAVDLSRSWVIGDRPTDVQLARNIGCRAVRIALAADPAADATAPGLREAAQCIIRQERHARVDRTTKETTIDVDVVLDGSGRHEISTGIGFFDHMLEQLAKHSDIDMTVHVTGDLKIDEHHTVEDTGLALGEAIRRALGDKRGIGRYGYAAPMDESLAQIALDLSGRPFCSVRASFRRERIGDLPTELVEDFLRAFADGLRATMHVSVTGRNEHHMVEALFKTLAQVLRQAVRPDRPGSGVPSTKGVL